MIYHSAFQRCYRWVLSKRNGAVNLPLFRMLSGQEQPDSGSITMGETVVLASVDQFLDSMDDKKTVWEEVV